MIIFLFLILFFFIYQDAQFMRKTDQAVYEKVFVFSPLKWGIYGSVLFCGALPMYLLRRSRFCAVDNMDEKRRFGFQAVGVLLSWIVFTATLELGVRFLEGWGITLKDDLATALSFMALETGYMIMLIVRAAKRHAVKGVRDYISWRPTQQSQWYVVGVAVLLGLSFAFLAATFLVHRSITPPTPMTDLLDANQSPVTFVFFLIMGLAVAPLIEEVVFRGYFFQALMVTRGRIWAISVIALTFALLHVPQYWGDWGAVIVVACVGMALTLMRYVSGSIIPSVAMHYTYNIAVVIIPAMLIAFQNTSFIEYMARYDQLTFTQRRSLLEKTIQHNPNFYEGYASLADELNKKGENLDQALRYIETALILSPERKIYQDLRQEILNNIRTQHDVEAVFSQ